MINCVIFLFKSVNAYYLYILYRDIQNENRIQIKRKNKLNRIYLDLRIHTIEKLIGRTTTKSQNAIAHIQCTFHCISIG